MWTKDTELAYEIPTPYSSGGELSPRNPITMEAIKDVLTYQPFIRFNCENFLEFKLYDH